MTELLTTEEVAEYLGVSESTMRRWRRMRFGPPWRQIGRAVRYRRVDRARRPISTNHY